MKIAITHDGFDWTVFIIIGLDMDKKEHIVGIFSEESDAYEYAGRYEVNGIVKKVNAQTIA